MASREYLNELHNVFSRVSNLLNKLENEMIDLHKKKMLAMQEKTILTLGLIFVWQRELDLLLSRDVLLVGETKSSVWKIWSKTQKMTKLEKVLWTL